MTEGTLGETLSAHLFAFQHLNLKKKIKNSAPKQPTHVSESTLEHDIAQKVATLRWTD